MYHPNLWGGWCYALDTSHPGFLDHLRATFAGLVADGFTYHKLDFLYAGALDGRRYDAGLTGAQALRLGLDAIREAVGDDGFLLGCGCPFGPAVGAVDAMRVSTDVWRQWSRPASLAGYPETGSGLRNSMRASVLRAPLHRRLWINDPDCLLLESLPGGLSAHHRAAMVATVAGTGGFTMLSDDLSAYSDADWETVRSVSERPGRDTPLDLVDPFAPAPVVRSAASELQVDWRGAGRAELCDLDDRRSPTGAGW
jgi:alpha-galactosidase